MQPYVRFAEPPITEEDVEAVASVVRSGWLTTGNQAAQLEKELSDYLECPHVVSVASCTHALEICLRYLDLPPGARVGVPAWTFVSTALAIIHAGHRPVILDVEPNELNLSPASLRQAAADLSAIVPVHFAGNPVASDIYDIASENNLKVIEDGAHALGAFAAERPLSGQGATGICFSFYATKNIAAGEGGAIATHDDALAEFALSHRLHGLSKDAWRRYHADGDADYELLGAGLKANMPDVLAALARSQLKRFGTTQQRRRELVGIYRSRLGEIQAIRPLPAEPRTEGADHLLVVHLDPPLERHVVVQELTKQDIQTSVHFRPLHEFPWLRANSDIPVGGLRNADALSGRVLSLPLHPKMSDGDVHRVCDVLTKISYASSLCDPQ